MTTADDTVDLLQGTGRNTSLARAFEVLEALAAHETGASVAELAKATGLPRSTVARLLASLFDVGAAARPRGGRQWVLGPTISRLAAGVDSTSALAARARPILNELSARFREAAMIAVPVDALSARVLDQVPCPRIVGAVPSWSEPLLTSPASGTVRMLLAELDPTEARTALQHLRREQFTSATKTGVDELVRAVEEVRSLGHSTVVDEIEEGLAGVGVAVRDRHARLVGLLSVYLPTVRLAEAMRSGLVEQLHRSAERLREQSRATE